MKKKIICMLIAVLIISVFIMQFFIGTKPFKALDVSDIAYVEVELYPPDVILTLNDEQLSEFAALAQEVVIYRKDNSYIGRSGQAVIFTLAKTDGTKVRITACNPFLIIDGTGYRTKYAPCEGLNRFANDLL